MMENNEDKELFDESDLPEGDLSEMPFGFGELFAEFEAFDFEVTGQNRKNGDERDGGEDTSLVAQYIKDLGNIPIFSPDDERKAFRKYKEMREKFRRELYRFPLAKKIKKAEQELLTSVEMLEEEIIEERILGEIKFYIEEARKNGIAEHSSFEKKIGMKVSRLKLLGLFYLLKNR